MPTLTLHPLAPSHPCMTVAAALRFKGLDFERVDFQTGTQTEQMAPIYGAGNTTVPGLLVERVLSCLRDLDELLALRPAADLAQRWFPEYPGEVPIGAFPHGWVPTRT